MQMSFNAGQRDGWKYTYVGADLAAACRERIAECVLVEKRASEKLKRTMDLPPTKGKSSLISEFESVRSRMSALAEQYALLEAEFLRPAGKAREFMLDANDVKFFGLFRTADDKHGMIGGYTDDDATMPAADNVDAVGPG